MAGLLATGRIGEGFTVERFGLRDHALEPSLAALTQPSLHVIGDDERRLQAGFLALFVLHESGRFDEGVPLSDTQLALHARQGRHGMGADLADGVVEGLQEGVGELNALVEAHVETDPSPHAGVGVGEEMPLQCRRDTLVFEAGHQVHEDRGDLRTGRASSRVLEGLEERWNSLHPGEEQLLPGFDQRLAAAVPQLFDMVLNRGTTACG